MIVQPNQFQDTNGKWWELRLTVGAARRVKAATGVDLLQSINPEAKVFKNLSEDPYLIYDVICSLLALDQGDAQRLGDALDEERLNQAGEALIHAVLDFFPQSRREPLKKVIDRSKEEWNKVSSQATAELVKAAEEIEVSELIRGNTAISSRATSASTRRPSASAS